MDKDQTGVVLGVSAERLRSQVTEAFGCLAQGAVAISSEPSRAGIMCILFTPLSLRPHVAPEHTRCPEQMW